MISRVTFSAGHSCFCFFFLFQLLSTFSQIPTKISPAATELASSATLSRDGVTTVTMAALWVFVLVSSSSFFALCRATASTDAMSLLGFKDSISLDPGGLLSSWNASVSHCTWRGVTCGRGAGRVVALNITGAGSEQGKLAGKGTSLVGTLSGAVGDLTLLRILSIPHNAFSGEIDGSVWRLQFLEVLELQGNNFSGHIPDQISYVQSLRVLNLSFNSFAGQIPNSLIGRGRIKAIDLSNNQLSGEFIVDSFSSCTSLRHLKLSNNYLVGSIPPEIGKCRNLKTLLLDGNILEGRIPAEIGRIQELRVLDVSRNSLTDRVPKELGNCKKLSVLVLTNLANFDGSSGGGSMGEFNAFEWGIPSEVLLLPSLQILWAPRANLGGRLPGHRNASCSLRVLNLGQNYFTGFMPESLGMCKNLTFLDLSSNYLTGYFPKTLQVRCMVYFNISRNNITGTIPSSGEGGCDSGNDMVLYEKEAKFLDMEDLQNAYTSIPFWGWNFSFVHDFSWNSFTGSLPSFSVGDELLGARGNLTYRLLLNNNRFNGSLLGELVSSCNNLNRFSVNLSMNQISGEIYPQLLLNCPCLTEFEAAHNRIKGSISPETSNLVMLERVDLTRNKLFGSLPGDLGKLKSLKWLLLGGNNLTGEIPDQLGQLPSLMALDLSQNALTGSIPASLTNDSVLETLLLNDNKLSGEIPSSFSHLSGLTTLDLSFNNLSGHIPHLQHLSSCDSFRGNGYLHSCPDSESSPPAALPVPLDVHKHNQRKLKSIIIAVVTSLSVVFCALLIITVVVFGRRKLGRVGTQRGKVVVTFADTPTELNYDNVVRATSNFSIRNLIGTGGFGSTYKAELVPGYLVAVKRLSLCRFQGIQQFDAEIRTLGRVRHKNLVTLIGYYCGEAEMFLVYNYLSGGNLETFIHNKSGTNIQWAVIHKIAIDIAQALAYLHYSCVPRIVHRDIKPSNILLDNELNAYLSDFGLARLLEVSETHATTDVAGTFGYVAPEYATTCRVSDKSDVYSFGVVLLELMSGKKSLDPSFSEYGDGFNIVSWAKMLIREGRASELFRMELWEAGPKENLLEMLRLASSCTVESLSVRPSTKQVLGKLKQLKS